MGYPSISCSQGNELLFMNLHAHENAVLSLLCQPPTGLRLKSTVSCGAWDGWQSENYLEQEHGLKALPLALFPLEATTNELNDIIL
jgi:hypothetical protein